MALTLAQLQTLKAYIAADGTLNAIPNDTDGAFAIAQLLNLNASPDYNVWKESVSTSDVGKTVSYVAIAAMTSSNTGRVQLFYNMNPGSFNPARLDIRTFFDETFSGALGGDGQKTRDDLQILWRRLATRFETIYATGGNGSFATPSTLVVVGPVTYPEVQSARSLP